MVLYPHPAFSLFPLNTRNNYVPGVTKKPVGRSQPSHWPMNLIELSPQQLLLPPGPGEVGGNVAKKLSFSFIHIPQLRNVTRGSW